MQCLSLHNERYEITSNAGGLPLEQVMLLTKMQVFLISLLNKEMHHDIYFKGRLRYFVIHRVKDLPVPDWLWHYLITFTIPVPIAVYLNFLKIWKTSG